MVRVAKKLCEAGAVYGIKVEPHFSDCSGNSIADKWRRLSCSQRQIERYAIPKAEAILYFASCESKYVMELA
jgi:hypothetical protein